MIRRVPGIVSTPINPGALENRQVSSLLACRGPASTQRQLLSLRACHPHSRLERSQREAAPPPIMSGSWFNAGMRAFAHCDNNGATWPRRDGRASAVRVSPLSRATGRALTGMAR